MYKEIEETNERIKYLQLTYREILKKHNIPITKSPTGTNAAELNINAPDNQPVSVSNPNPAEKEATPT